MRTSVLAEIGINHDGDIAKAKRLIDEAQKSGCKGIKFQYRNLNRAYAKNANEIGDEIILTQIERTYLPANQILELKFYAQTLGIQAGISFFTTEDLSDFNNLGTDFDFFKIPSAEMLNFELILQLLETNKMVYISVGMHNEEEIESILSRIQSYPNWIPMQCVSNYPVADHNASLGYIQFLKEKWGREVGYSSHDENWENNIVALCLGATIIERHITESKVDSGLDHSSSSTPIEFRRLVDVAKNLDFLIKGNSPRIPNQGELLNKQNLGRSYYANKSIEQGTALDLQDFSYRSPQTGLGIAEANNVQGRPLLENINVNEVLSARHIEVEGEELSPHSIKLAKDLGISIPVRLADYHEIRMKIPSGNYEFHLSYKEVESGLLDFQVVPTDQFSVHLPDYINSTTLIDPFSNDEKTKILSRECIRKVVNFSEKLAGETGQRVPIVASLAGIGIARNTFYPSVKNLFQEFSTRNAVLTLQWLPPFAWYFGGSVKLTNMCHSEDVSWILEHGIPVTLDTSHLILGMNFYNFDAAMILESLLPNILHWHISDAIGTDGEGMQLGDGGVKSKQIISKTLSFEGLKVIEVWQGHFDDYKGFKVAINRLPNLWEKVKQ